MDLDMKRVETIELGGLNTAQCVPSAGGFDVSRQGKLKYPALASQ